MVLFVVYRFGMVGFWQGYMMLARVPAIRKSKLYQSRLARREFLDIRFDGQPFQIYFRIDAAIRRRFWKFTRSGRGIISQ